MPGKWSGECSCSWLPGSEVHRQMAAPHRLSVEIADDHFLLLLGRRCGVSDHTGRLLNLNFGSQLLPDASPGSWICSSLNNASEVLAGSFPDPVIVRSQVTEMKFLFWQLNYALLALRRDPSFAGRRGFGSSISSVVPHTIHLPIQDELTIENIHFYARSVNKLRLEKSARCA